MVERVQSSLLSALTDLVRWLDAAHVPSMVIGGVAASVLGQPRLTQDVDALAILPEERWASAMDAAARFGIVPRIDKPLEFARRSRVLLMKHLAETLSHEGGAGKCARDAEGRSVGNCSDQSADAPPPAESTTGSPPPNSTATGTPAECSDAALKSRLDICDPAAKDPPRNQ